MTIIETLIAKAKETEKDAGIGAALTELREAARKHPQDQKILFQIAVLLEKAKQFPAALGNYQRIAGQHEKLPPDVALGMARCLLASKRTERARALFEALDKKAPKQNKEVLVGLAGCSRHQKDLVAAENLVRAALKLDADFKPACHELAEILIANNDDEQALQLLEKNISRRDLHGDSLDLWMSRLKEMKREKYLQEKLAELCATFPDKVEFVFGYGISCHRAGEISLARPALEKADKLLPNNSKILYEMGIVERTYGNIEKSQKLIKQSLNLRPDFPAGLRTYGVDHKYTYGDEEFRRLNKVAANLTDMIEEDQVQMQYALAKAFDDVGELEAAFAHYAISGAKKRKQDTYNEKNNIKLFDILKKLLNRNFFDIPREKGCLSDVPVFILGMPRSGTSLLEQILSSHPDIFGAGELKLMTGVLENISVGEARLRMNEIEPDFPYEINAGYEARGQRYVDKLCRLAPEGINYRRIVDKMPGNFNFVGLIHLMLPNAKIIHSQRHPVETCLSCYRIHFAEGHQWTYNLRELGRYYKRYWNLMQHWRETLPGVMYEARYEDNVADVEGSAKALINYMELEWNDNCLNFYNTDRPVKTASASQVRKPIYTTSTNRWKKYEKFLEPLLEELGDIPAQYEKMLEIPRQ